MQPSLGERIGRIRVLLGEAATGPEAVADWTSRGEQGEFAGEVVWVAYCPEKPAELIRMVRVCRKGGAIGFILPDKTLHMDAYVLAVNKIRQIQSNPEMLRKVEAKRSVHSHTELVRVVHELAAEDLTELLKIKDVSKRRERAEALMGVRVSGQEKLDVHIVEDVLKENLSDQSLKNLIMNLTGGRDDAGDEMSGDNDSHGGVSLAPKPDDVTTNDT